MDAADFFYNPITVMPNGPNRFSRALSPASLLLLIKEEEEKKSLQAAGRQQQQIGLHFSIFWTG